MAAGRAAQAAATRTQLRLRPCLLLRPDCCLLLFLLLLLLPGPLLLPYCIVVHAWQQELRACSWLASARMLLQLWQKWQQEASCWLTPPADAAAVQRHQDAPELLACSLPALQGAATRTAGQQGLSLPRAEAAAEAAGGEQQTAGGLGG